MLGYVRWKAFSPRMELAFESFDNHLNFIIAHRKTMVRVTIFKDAIDFIHNSQQLDEVYQRLVGVHLAILLEGEGTLLHIRGICNW